jgi:hypothetical protein
LYDMTFGRQKLYRKNEIGERWPEIATFPR